MNTSIVNTIALALDIAGATLIFLGSERLTNILSKISLLVASGVGKMDSKIEPGLLSEFLKGADKATKMSRVGLILLVIGFLGQVLATWLK
jgi:hypothetical protein